MPYYDRKCNSCNAIQVDCWENVYDVPDPACGCGGVFERNMFVTRAKNLSDGSNRGVIGDECDVTARHGLCNPDGSPRRYSSKTEMRKEAEKRGLVNHVEHKSDHRGGDKSRQTTRWV